MNKGRPKKQRGRFRNLVLVLLGLSMVGALYFASRAKQPSPSAPSGSPAPTATTHVELTPPPAAKPGVPPYHNSAEAAKPFPRLLPATYFRSHPVVARAYQIASEIPGVIAQQPCYCYCDKFGHRSLLDCYASEHGAG